MADTGESPHHVPGNPSPSMFGGDNNPNPSPNHISGNLPVGFTPDASHWLGDDLHEIEGNNGGLGTMPEARVATNARGMGDNTKRR